MTDSQYVKVLTKDLFPQELHECKTWLNWKLLPSGAKSPINEWGKAAGYSDETIWVSLDDAITRANANDNVHVGISLKSDGLKVDNYYLWCLDFDGWSHGTEGEDDGAIDFIRKLGSYTEVSPSGTGFKIFILSDKPPAKTQKIQFPPSKFASLNPEVTKYQARAVEVFSRGRFLAMTGNSLFKTVQPRAYIPEAELDLILLELDVWAKREGGLGVGSVITTKSESAGTDASNRSERTGYGKLTEIGLKNVLSKIDHRDEENWSAAANSIARPYGEAGRVYFIEWSEHGYGQGEYVGFDEAEADARYTRALKEVAGKNGYGCKHLYEMAGVTPTNKDWELDEALKKALYDTFDAAMLNSHNPSESDQLPLPLDTPTDIIDLLNRDHFVAMEGSSLWVFKEAYDAELKVDKLDRYKPVAFKDLHNQSILVEGKSKRIGEYWFSHPQRKTYRKGFVFMPEGNCPNGAYNLWRGFGVKPVQGDVDQILEYIKSVLCCEDETNYNYLIKWLAWGVQHADMQGEVAVVMRGLKGTGKSTLGRLMVRLYGRHGIQITQARHLVGNFNAHLQGKVFLFADEAFFAGNRHDEDVLKGLVTESHVQIEKKGIDPVTARNRLQILMSSNRDWVVPVSSDERRYFILDVSDKRIGDKTYWKELNTFIDNGGAEAFLYLLQHMDLTGFDVRSPPNTSGLDAQKLQNLDAVESVVHDWLETGKVCGWTWSEAGLEVSTEDVFTKIGEFCRNSPRHRYLNLPRESVGKKIKQLIGATKKRKRSGAELNYVYVLPSLDDARATFTAHMKLTASIWGDDDAGGVGESHHPDELHLAA
jgi:hypothetical protein